MANHGFAPNLMCYNCGSEDRASGNWVRLGTLWRLHNEFFSCVNLYMIWNRKYLYLTKSALCRGLLRACAVRGDVNAAKSWFSALLSNGHYSAPGSNVWDKGQMLEDEGENICSIISEFSTSHNVFG